MNGEPRRKGRSLNCRAPPGQTSPLTTCSSARRDRFRQPAILPISRAAFDNHDGRLLVLDPVGNVHLG